MIARALLLATALCAASAATAFAQTASVQSRSDVFATPALRASVTVTGDLVRIGDIIDNAGSAAQIAIYRAPDLGTTGFKKQRAAFQDLIYDHVRRVGAQASDQGTILPVGVDIGGGVKTVGTPRLMSQGTLSPTGNELDVAVRGEGFFKIQVPDGTYAYTRDGSFQMDAQGRIVTAQGNPVQPTITIPQSASGLSINTQGQVSVLLPGSTTPTTVGQIGLTRFINKAGLNPIGDNLFTDTPASGTPQDGIANTDGFGDMQQSNLEQANVEVVTEISDLIAAQRAYEMNAKVVSAADQMMQSTANMFR